MFTGIIECKGTIKAIERDKGNVHFTVSSPISGQLKPDQSVSHDGVCLTITANDKESHRVTVIEETLKKTNLASWGLGKKVNLERALLLSDRLDGHIVQGHVDTTADCVKIENRGGSDNFTFSFDERHAALVIEKGSICINGVSLTAFNCTENSLTVSIIPYTLEHTTFSELKVGDKVNLEFDVLGKYILRARQLEHLKK